MLPKCAHRCGENFDHCSKWGNRNNKCEPVTLEAFREEVDQCEMEQVCQNCSIYGNDFVLITDEDIEALKNGKVLYWIDEYGTFLAYKKGENDEFSSTI